MMFDYFLFFSKYDEFGLEGDEMWLAVSSDRRVSIWAADWHKDQCELIDWLTFPAPIEPQVRLISILFVREVNGLCETSSMCY